VVQSILQSHVTFDISIVQALDTGCMEVVCRVVWYKLLLLLHPIQGVNMIMALQDCKAIFI
jgi:hypothetical protein